MFGIKLSLPEHVQVNLDPNPNDGGQTFLLVIRGRLGPESQEFTLQKAVPRDVSAIQFGKDLLAAINHIYQQAQQQRQQQG